MVRRRVAAGVAVVLLILIVLLINGCLKSQKTQGLKDYNHQTGEIVQESETQVAKPLFTALAGAAGKSALNVETQVDQLRVEAQKQAQRAKELKVPSEMSGAQRYLLSTMNFRAEGLDKIAAQLPAALSGQNKNAISKIAGSMQTFLASDVIYSQRVAPLIQETLSSDGVHEATRASRFLPNIGWLETATVEQRLTGQGGSGSQSAVAPGTHGSALVGVAVGTNSLQPEPTLNHVAGGSNPTFTVTVENTGSNPETNVKVNVTVTAAGKELKGTHAINQTQPGSKANVEIPVAGVPLGVAAKVQVEVVAVPGETNTENNNNTYLALFGE